MRCVTRTEDAYLDARLRYKNVRSCENCFTCSLDIGSQTRQLVKSKVKFTAFGLGHSLYCSNSHSNSTRKYLYIIWEERISVMIKTVQMPSSVFWNIIIYVYVGRIVFLCTLMVWRVGLNTKGMFYVWNYKTWSMEQDCYLNEWIWQ